MNSWFSPFDSQKLPAEENDFKRTLSGLPPRPGASLFTMDNFVEIGHKLALFYVPFLFALCFHEFAHGWIAKTRGDNTAELMGRLTLNPMAHADMIGTFALPIMAIVFSVPIFFGWAKPVPVNIRNLKNPRVDMFWIALAGPASNILLAVLGLLFWE
jgi:Zn-dependent protease